MPAGGVQPFVKRIHQAEFASLTGKRSATILPPARSQMVHAVETFPSTIASPAERGESARWEPPPSPALFLRAERQKRRRRQNRWQAAVPTSIQTSSPPASPSKIRTRRHTESNLLARMEDSLATRIPARRPPLSRRIRERRTPWHPASRSQRSKYRRKHRAFPGHVPAAERHFPCAAAL